MSNTGIQVERAGTPRKIVDGDRAVTFVPLAIKRRGARTVLLPPAGAETAIPIPRHDLPLLKALGKAFYWQKLIDQGIAEDAAAIARQERLDRTWVSETLRLTLLAPDIVMAILDGRQPRTLSLQKVRRGVPIDWIEQHAQYDIVCHG
jgi:hypothetical protein